LFWSLQRHCPCTKAWAVERRTTRYTFLKILKLNGLASTTAVGRPNLREQRQKQRSNYRLSSYFNSTPSMNVTSGSIKWKLTRKRTRSQINFISFTIELTFQYHPAKQFRPGKKIKSVNHLSLCREWSSELAIRPSLLFQGCIVTSS
jgi:hypothetical protein